MSTYTITTLCTVLWYMSVLLTWMRVNQQMSLFADHSPHGWLMIFLAFLGSVAVNFILNPLAWIVAGCYIHAARKEGKTSKWQFYPSLIGILLLACALAAVFTNIKLPVKFLNPDDSNEAAIPIGHRAVRAPEVSGIMFSGNPKVLIDGHVLKQGEEIDGFVIEEITESTVTFRGPDGTTVTRRVK